MAHTPGPWGFAIDTDSIVFCGSGSVCKRPSATSGGPAGRNWKANARLISAAPDLLEAIKTLVECSDYGDVQQDADAWKDARAAIAKATSAE